ncbi:MAG: transketolase family protein [Eubacteriaceae bacterium]|nr:transketolase family protein [Eubacteriaceae bacterium]
MATERATRDILGATLIELGKADENIVVFDADLSSSTKMAEFAAVFPDRHFNAGIAEMNMAGMAAGMASMGKTAFISTFAIFGTGRAYEVVRDLVCYPNFNVKLAMTHAGLTVGEDGATHQSVEDIALMAALPNMKVFVPADAEEARQMVMAAAKIQGPVYIRLGRDKTEDIYTPETYTYSMKPDKLKDGADVAIFACGIMVARALSAAKDLEAEGISAAVVNCSTLKPFDEGFFARIAGSVKGIVTCEEHSIYGGLNSVVSQAAGKLSPLPIEAVAIGDTFGESGKPAELLEKYGLTASAIKEKARSVLLKAK